ncbi:MAG: membrane protein insertion efficiency factor YidD [Patescibacteria group bacterium]
MPRLTCIKLIEFYQNTLSPDHGPLKDLHPHGFCRHEPSCSEYGKKMIKERGIIIGFLLMIKRVLSCNPFEKPTRSI